jgi:hypothetical protein
MKLTLIVGNLLSWIGTGIAFLGFAFKEAGESLEKRKSTIESELSTHRVLTAQAATQLGILQSQQLLDKLMADGSDEDKATRDHSMLILRDTANLRETQATLRVDLDDVSRLIDTLPMFSRNLKTQFRNLEAQIHNGDSKVQSTLEPSTITNWTRVAELKLAVVQLLMEKVKVAVFSDNVITTAKKQAEVIGWLRYFCLWCWRILFVLGLGLALYGSLTGQKVGGGSE